MGSIPIARSILYVLGGLVALVAAAAVALVLTFDPNDWKDEIVAAAREHTGRELVIEGDLSWSLFPWLGIRTGPLALGNPEGFSGAAPLVHLASADVRVRLMPLFKGRIEADTIEVAGLALILRRNAEGRANWEGLGKADDDEKPEDADPAKARAFSAAGIRLRDATLVFDDAHAGTRHALEGIQVSTGPVGGDGPLAVDLGFQYARPDAAPVRVQLQGTVRPDPDTGTVSLDDLKAGIDETRITGRASLATSAEGAIRADLALDRIDVDRYVGARGAGSGTAPDTASSATGAIPLPIDLLKTLDLDVTLRIGRIVMMGLSASDVTLRLRDLQGLVTLGPNRATLYGGRWEGSSVIDVRPPAPYWQFNESLRGVSVGALLRDADLYRKYSGTGSVTLKLAAHGATSDAMRRSLGGTARIDLRDGRIEGVDLLKTVREARAVVDQVRGHAASVRPAASDNTAFTKLAASFTLVRGVATTDDLSLEGPVLRATGKGSADLGAKTLDFRLAVTPTEEVARLGTDIPVTVRGRFAEPDVSVALGDVARRAAEKEVRKQIERKLGGPAEEKLKERLGEGLQRLFGR